MSGTRHDRFVVIALAVLAAIGGAVSSGAPSGLGPADSLFRAGLAALVTVAASRARQWSGLILAATAFAVAHSWQLVPAGAALLLGFVMTARPIRPRVAGAVVGAISIQVLLRQHPYAFHGVPTLIGAAAVLPTLVSAHRRGRAPARRRDRWVVAGTAGLAVLATGAFAVALLFARQDLQAGAARAKAALVAARAGDADTANRELDDAGAALARSTSFIGSWWAAPARAVPLVGQQVAAVTVMDEEARRVVRSARRTATIGDYRRLKYQTGRLDVGRLEQLRAPIAESAHALARANARLADLDRSWLLAPLRSRLDDFGREVARAAPEAEMASSVVATAPDLLGAHGTRHYFVAFTTPAEVRGAGGFIGNYGELTAQDGKIRLTRSGGTPELVFAAPKGKRHLRGLSDYLARYGDFHPADYFQDLTFSPHFPFDAEAIEQLYPQSGGRRVDGVISIDPVALASLLEFTGPITVPGLDTPLTSANAADILLRKQYVILGDEKTRKDLLVEASRITFDRLTTGNLPAPEELVKVLGPMVAQRRIMLHSTRPAEQRMFTRIKADGALPVAGGHDVLSIASQNSGNNKIDTFLHRSVAYDATVDPATGTVASTATVTLRNDAPTSGLPDIVIGNAANVPDGTNLMSLSLYSALPLVDATLDGRPLNLEVGREAGLRVYTVRLEIPAKSTQVVRVRLAGGVDLRAGYQLIAMPQPVANPDQLSVSVRARSAWKLVAPKALRIHAGHADAGPRPLKTTSSFTTAFTRR